jgi:di/tricarboxylate transporter
MAHLGRWRRGQGWLWGLGGGLALIGAIALGSHWQLSPALETLSWKGWGAIAVTVVTFGLNATTHLPPELVFLGGLGVLLVSGMLSEAEALAGFSNSGMITVAVMYVVVTGLQQTGALGWVSQRVLGLPRHPAMAMVRLMVPVMGLSAVLNNTPVVALMIPVVNDWCRKLRLSPSKLMLPLSYAAIFGGTCTLIGTSTNLVVNGLLMETGAPGLGLLAIAWVGIPCAIAATALLFLTQRWLLPIRKPVMGEGDDVRQYTLEMVVTTGGPLVGKTIEQAGLRHLPNLYLMEVVRGPQVVPAVTPQEILRAQDQLVFVGAVDSIVDLHRFRGLEPATDQVFKLNGSRRDRTLVEAVVSSQCPLVGLTIRDGQFRSRYGAVVLAVARDGGRLSGKVGDMVLQPGDTLLLESTPLFLEQQRRSRDFYWVSNIPDSAPLNHDKAPLALGILTAMVAAAALNQLPMLQAAIAAAIALLVTGCCSPHRALHQVEWSVLLVIGASLGLGKALEVTGAAAAISTTFMAPAGDNPWLALTVIYGVTTLLTEVVTNNAAAALMFPITLALTDALGVSITPFVIAIMVAASASFATPIGYQTNLMVYGPGGYRFTDFLRVGIPLNLLYWGLTVAIAPRVFPF